MTPSLSFSRSIMYEAGTGVLYNGEPYETVAISEEAGKQILEEARNANLVTIMTEPIEAALSSLSNKLKNASGQAKTGLRLGDSLLKGTGGGLYTVISTLADSGIDNSSGQVIPASSRLMADADDNEEYNEDEDAVPVGCLTIGEPYMVGFFTDEECTEAATEQEVDSAGVTLTLNYTDERLAAAGAEADPVIRMYRFDAEKNLYVLVPDSRQDVEKKTVKAPVSKAGEYILAIDAEGPVIDNFVQTDASLKPAFSVFVGDAGAGRFPLLAG